jgi:hypothetical protein
MIEFDNKAHGKMIMDAMASKFSADTMTVISRVAEDDTIGDELMGGVVYENWTGRGGSVVCHFAGFHPRWLNRDMLWVIYHYPFRQLDCNQIIVQVKANNDASNKVVTGMGFEPVVRLEAIYPDTDVILYRMWRVDCRFLSYKPRNLKSGRMDQDGQARRTGTPGL